MYVSISMLATKEGCSVATISRIAREMEGSGNYPTAIRRAGKTLINTEDFEHYVCRRRRKRNEKI